MKDNTSIKLDLNHYYSTHNRLTLQTIGNPSPPAFYRKTLETNPATIGNPSPNSPAPPPFHRQTLETNPANHWQPNPNPSATPIHTAYKYTLYHCCARFAPMLRASPYGHSSTEPLWHATPTAIFPLLSIFETVINLKHKNSQTR